MTTRAAALRHVGIGLGRIRHWNDGLGEFSRQLCGALAARADELRERDCIALHFHLPHEFHGLFGAQVGYLATHTLQRAAHLRTTGFALWHTLHQHNRLRAPLGTRRRVETVHDLNFLHTKRGGKLEGYRARLARRLAAADAVVAITQYVAGDLARELPSLRVAPQVIHNGATDLSGAPQTPPAGIGEIAARPFLLHVSRLAPTKNITALLDLAAAWPEQPLVLAGAASDYTATVRRSIAERGLHNVTLLLDIGEAEKAWLYAHCMGFLFPSLAEGFGLPPIEAMHFGKPVFLSRLTSLPEVGGELAFYFDTFDGPQMRARIEAGLAAHQAPGRADAVIAHARQFSWSRCALSYIALYRRLLADDPA
ncbi:glycosyltransferase family 4 protein [Aquincola sp. S2]|uniref:Glycosyltransferase family 4 protein n=1 Tax=Pseudaquabacterium terrae TaxID=2732868 RepID=A0ABX2EH30_9BURK|nr:glycosyltransferase family 1 protein [Aquabacterium terrae]NRF67926.1 glycosyltransferase family 4 protein [Aquabacterium terrae]